MSVSRRVIIIAGPNGAGKTTFAKAFLPNEAACPRFINADLIFLKLRSVKLALARVKARVAQRGHHIPADIIRRRFRQGWENFETLYRPLVNHWELYDNSENSQILIEQGDNP